MRALLASAGTRGDVQPLIALGQRLRANGHDVVLAAAPCFRDEAMHFGLSFEPMGRDVKAWLREARTATPLGLLQLLNRALSAELVSQLGQQDRLSEMVRQLESLLCVRRAGTLRAHGAHR